MSTSRNSQKAPSRTSSKSASRKSAISELNSVFAPFLTALVDSSSSDEEDDESDGDSDSDSVAPDPLKQFAKKAPSRVGSTHSAPAAPTRRAAPATPARPAASLQRWNSERATSVSHSQGSRGGGGGFTGFFRNLIGDLGGESGRTRDYTEDWVKKDSESETEEDDDLREKAFYFGDAEERKKEEDYASFGFGDSEENEQSGEFDSEFLLEDSDNSDDIADWGFGLGFGGSKKKELQQVKKLNQNHRLPANVRRGQLALKDAPSQAPSPPSVQPLQPSTQPTTMPPTALSTSRWADSTSSSSSEPSLAPSPVNGANPALPKLTEEQAPEPKLKDITPLPLQEPSPPQRSTEESTSTNGTRHVFDSVAKHLLSAPARNGASTRSSSPNARTTVKMGKRTVIIQIPSETPFGKPEKLGGKPMPLTFEDVEKRMQHFRDLGYDVDVIGANEGGQTRAIFPLDNKGKVDSSEVIVSIPDRRGMFACLE